MDLIFLIKESSVGDTRGRMECLTLTRATKRIHTRMSRAKRRAGDPPSSAETRP